MADFALDLVKSHDPDLALWTNPQEEFASDENGQVVDNSPFVYPRVTLRGFLPANSSHLSDLGKKRGDLDWSSVLLCAWWIDERDEFLNRLLVLAHQLKTCSQFSLRTFRQLYSLGFGHLHVGCAKF